MSGQTNERFWRNESTFADYLAAVTLWDKRKERRGQHAFNVLRFFREDIARKITGTNADPFYVDDNLPEFFTKVGEMWGEE